ncbi:hypothetical protein J6590_007808 [Homalodisca vitripennis]|nr:hypothetical protein J6590_007808 [Homalodisca vitripennis]
MPPRKKSALSRHSARAIATKRIRNNQSNDQRAKVNELNRIRTSASRMMLSQEEKETSNLNDRLRMQSNRAVANRSGDARLQNPLEPEVLIQINFYIVLYLSTLGKVFALTSILESFTPIGAAPLYTFVYRNTFLQVPGAVFLVSAALSITAVLMVSIVFVIQKFVMEECYPTCCLEEFNEEPTE